MDRVASLTEVYINGAFSLPAGFQKTCVLGTLEVDLDSLVQSVDCYCLSGVVSGTPAKNNRFVMSAKDVWRYVRIII
jgi:hypothetical protein